MKAMMTQSSKDFDPSRYYTLHIKSMLDEALYYTFSTCVGILFHSRVIMDIQVEI